MNKAKRIMDYMDEENVAVICTEIGKIDDQATPLKQARYINDLLNAVDIGGKNLHIFDDKIIAVYQKCYCNIPKKVENLNKNYCECSAGWYMRLFSEVFETQVTVKIVDTIVNGAAECTFEM